MNVEGQHALVVRTKERVSHHRLAWMFRHRIPRVFPELDETVQEWPVII
jgi:hypothetical protein